jgi:hypothetical protein
VELEKMRLADRLEPVQLGCPIFAGSHHQIGVMDWDGEQREDGVRKKTIERLAAKSATDVEQLGMRRQTWSGLIGLNSKSISGGRSLTSILICWENWVLYIV